LENNPEIKDKVKIEEFEAEPHENITPRDRSKSAKDITKSSRDDHSKEPERATKPTPPISTIEKGANGVTEWVHPGTGSNTSSSIPPSPLNTAPPQRGTS
jgi:hypothetical protein